MNFANITKKITHVIAVALSSVVVFVVSPAGQSLIHQYPKISGAAGILVALGSLYHNPDKQ